ncbi:hypothetical protein SLA2020_027190 [Shorea laevis]
MPCITFLHSQMVLVPGNALIIISLLLLIPPCLAQWNATATSSRWLKNVTNWRRPRPEGCSYRPWICRQGQQPPTVRMRCCRNKCVDVASDINHCGLCGIRCRFSWQCCRGSCTNTNFNRFNCGRCGRRCSGRVRCLYGLCGYAQPLPPRPPFPRPRPLPLRSTGVDPPPMTSE